MTDILRYLASHGFEPSLVLLAAIVIFWTWWGRKGAGFATSVLLQAGWRAIKMGVLLWPHTRLISLLAILLGLLYYPFVIWFAAKIPAVLFVELAP